MGSERQKKKETRSVSKRITHSYILALSMIALFSLGGHFSIRSVIGTHDKGIEVSQDIARQQMLTQRVALLALDLASRTSDLERADLRKSLSKSITEMEGIHNSLLEEQGEWKLLTTYAREDGGAYLNPPIDLEIRIQTFLSKARSVLSKSDTVLSAEDPDVKFLVSVGSDSLLESIDHAVQHYHEITQSRLEFLVLLETVLFLATILVLVVEAIFIFKPLVRTVRAKIIELRRAEKELNAVIDTAGGGILTCNTNGVIQRANASVEDMLDVGEKRIKGRSIMEFMEHNGESFHDEIQSFPNNEWVEVNITSALGAVFPAMINVSLTEVFHTRLYTIAIMDMSERKQHEQELEESLRQKSLLLQEIHHRVKNNLQVISSFLSIQSRNIDDEGIRAQLEESRNRVDAMALIHEELYKSTDLSTIEFDRYVEDLIKQLFRSSGVDEKNISLELDIKDASFDIDTAVPCGLMVNELVSNCLEHAFQEDQTDSKIAISSYQDGSGYVHLIVQDNGVGLPENFDVSTSRSMGLRIVNALVMQLNGTLEIEGDSGARFHLCFQRSSETETKDTSTKNVIH